MFHRYIHCLACACLILMLAGCGGGGGSSSSSPDDPPQEYQDITIPPALQGTSGAVGLTAAPMDLQYCAWIIPLGNLNPPGHTFPTSHIYFVYTDDSGLQNIYAPADGYIVKVKAYGSPTPDDFSIIIAYTSTFYTEFGHVAQLGDVITDQTGPITSEGEHDLAIPVSSGQVVGLSGHRPLSACLDLVLTNLDYTAPGIIHPDRYPPNAAHNDAPLKYYVEPAAAELYAKVHPWAVDPDGKYDYDIPDRLSGNWFGPGYDVGSSEDDWANQLAFVGDVFDSSLIRISMGGELGMVGYYAVNPDDPRPADVSVATGKVCYRLYATYSGQQTPDLADQVGLLVVEMTDANTIQVECFPGSTAPSGDFTAAARTYTR